MNKHAIGVFFVLCQGMALEAREKPQPNIVLAQVSRQCIKIWCLIRNIVEDNVPTLTKQATEADALEQLDVLLCRVMKVRDNISHMSTDPLSDRQAADYIDSSLGCIEQYTYDLVERYPGNWSTIIQEQVFRTQKAYDDHVTPLLTK